MRIYDKLGQENRRRAS